MFNGVLDSIHGDDVSIMDQGDGPSDLSFRYYVSDTESVAPVKVSRGNKQGKLRCDVVKIRTLR